MKPCTYFLLWVVIFTLEFACLYVIGDIYGDECVAAFLVLAMIDLVLFSCADYYGVVKK